jgi:REP element-mobilizing transposase RayT
MVGFVVTPEHTNLLISEPATGTPSTVIQVLKQRVSRRLRRENRKTGAQFCPAFVDSDDSLQRFWPHRFYDFNVQSLKREWENFTTCT